MKRIFDYILLMVPAVLMIAGCSDSDEIAGAGPVLPQQEVPMLFSAAADDARQTRGTLIGGIHLDDDNPNDNYGKPGWWTLPWINGDAFSAFGVYYFDNMTILGQQFLEDQKVTYNGSTQEWEYSPLRYWPQQGYLDLFAYYPDTETLNKTLGLAQKPVYDSPDLALGDMPGATLVRRNAPGDHLALLPIGISSLRFWHENPLDTTMTMRYYCLPSALPAPEVTGMEHPIMDPPAAEEYNDAENQPDLMFAHRPHIAKMAVASPLNYAFTHSMMAVRFWIRGIDNQDVGANSTRFSRFKNLQDFEINSVSFGPVYSGGECIAFDNTNWTLYYKGLDEATQTSTEPVKMRYFWNYGSRQTTLADGSDQNMTTPAYGGYRKIYNTNDPDNDPKHKEWNKIHWPISYEHLPMDPGYEITPVSDIFTQTCGYALSSTAYEDNQEWWALPESYPLLPKFADHRGTDGHSAFIFPPQFFDPEVDYVRVTFTITSTGGEKLRCTLKAKIPMHETDVWWDADRKMLRVEDGQILDLYLTFNVDGREFFDFFIDSHVSPMHYGGGGGIDWGGW